MRRRELPVLPKNEGKMRRKELPVLPVFNVSNVSNEARPKGILWERGGGSVAQRGPLSPCFMSVSAPFCSLFRCFITSLSCPKPQRIP